MAQKCEICDRQTDFFEGVDYGDKCIFHCDKSDEVKWGNPESEDVKRFWRAIREQIRADINEQVQVHNFQYYIFPAFEKYLNYSQHHDEKLGYIAEEANFWIDTKTKLGIVLRFNSETRFDKAVFMYDANFSFVSFLQRAFFFFADFKKECSFTSAKYVGDFSFFWQSKFGGDVSFQKISCRSLRLSGCIFYDALKISINNEIVLDDFYFSNNVLKKDSFAYIYDVKCNRLKIESLQNHSSNLKLSNLEISKSIVIQGCMLDKAEFNGVRISDNATIELKNVSFIGSHLTNVKWGEINESRFDIDRQMARQLKSINDAQGETVIANDFYALEMRLRSKELNWREHFGEKLVQNIHGLVSNHSNDWVLPTIWFFAFAFLFAALAKGGLCALPLLLLFVVIGHGIYEVDKPTSDNSIHLSLAILGASLILFCLFSCDFEFLVALVNPLNFKDSKDLLSNTNLVLIYVCRIIEVFIGYQIITAIRKNTRRK